MEYKIDTKLPKEKYIKIFDPNGKLVCKTNDERKVDYILSQIAENRYEGFYSFWKGKRYEIINDGRISTHGVEIFPLHNEWMRKICGF